MTDIPHFAWPFQWVTNPDRTVTAAVVDQDSLADVQACVARVAGTPVGSRIELPAFGVTALAFQTGEINDSVLRSQIQRWEPRADVDIAELIDALDAGDRTVLLTVTEPNP